jgi:hypothetical protein
MNLVSSEFTLESTHVSEERANRGIFSCTDLPPIILEA